MSRARVFWAFVSVTAAVQILPNERAAHARCVRADGEEMAQAHLDLANQAYAEHQFEVALREYDLAHELCGSPLVFYGTAHSQWKLGHESEAARDFDRFLREATDAGQAQRQAAADSLRTLSVRLTLIDIAGPLEHAVVLVDGNTVAAWVSGAPLYLSPGRHTLRVQAPATGVVERLVVGMIGSRSRWEIPPQAIIATSPEPAPEAAPHRRSWWLWGGLGAVLIGGAVAAFVLTRSDRPSCPSVCP
jgi:hypothetical protein